MDILRESKKYLKRITNRADLRARAAEIEKELAFPLSAGVARMEPGRAKGQHKSSVEAEAIKRERLEGERAALLHEAEQREQERAYLVGFVDALKHSQQNWQGRAIDCIYLQGMSAREAALATMLRDAELKRQERYGLMSVGNVFLGLREPGGVYDHDGLYLMSQEEQEKLLRKWAGS